MRCCRYCPENQSDCKSHSDIGDVSAHPRPLQYSNACYQRQRGTYRDIRRVSGHKLVADCARAAFATFLVIREKSAWISGEAARGGQTRRTACFNRSSNRSPDLPAHHAESAPKPPLSEVIVPIRKCRD